MQFAAPRYRFTVCLLTSNLFCPRNITSVPSTDQWNAAWPHLQTWFASYYRVFRAKTLTASFINDAVWIPSLNYCTSCLLQVELKNNYAIEPHFLASQAYLQLIPDSFECPASWSLLVYFLRIRILIAYHLVVSAIAAISSLLLSSNLLIRLFSARLRYRERGERLGRLAPIE